MKTVKELIEAVPIVSENVLVEAAAQPLLFIDAARFRVQKMRNRSQAMARYDSWCSKLGLHIRRAKTGDKRVTEGEVKDRIQIHQTTRAYDEALQKAFAEEEFSKLLLEALRMRRDALRVIAEAQLAEGTKEAAEIDRIAERRKLHKRARELEQQRQD